MQHLHTFIRTSIFLNVALAGALASISNSMVGQSMPVPCYTPEIVKDLNLDSIKQAYCARMVLLALMHYPELKGVRIKCIQRRRFVPLTTMPSVLSTFFHKKANRRYKILISTNSRHVIDSILLQN
ncbi:MAG: hypothetical protein MUF42_15255, partial [Cytophagaceae bacterium]|nr:hypothetical protein [Cytophagaceae bacterium]